MPRIISLQFVKNVTQESPRRWMPLMSRSRSSIAGHCALCPLRIWAIDQEEYLLIQPYLGLKSCQDTSYLKITGCTPLEIVQSICKTSWLKSKANHFWHQLTMQFLLLVLHHYTLGFCKHLLHCLQYFQEKSFGKFPELLLVLNTGSLYTSLSVLL